MASGWTLDSFVLVGGDGGNGRRLWVAKVLLLFAMCLKDDSESREYAFLQYMEVTCHIAIVDKTLSCIF